MRDDDKLSCMILPLAADEGRAHVRSESYQHSCAKIGGKPLEHPISDLILFQLQTSAESAEHLIESTLPLLLRHGNQGADLSQSPRA